jgi:hypothetical protein
MYHVHVYHYQLLLYGLVVHTNVTGRESEKVAERGIGPNSLRGVIRQVLHRHGPAQRLGLGHDCTGDLAFVEHVAPVLLQQPEGAQIV